MGETRTWPIIHRKLTSSRSWLLLEKSRKKWKRKKLDQPDHEKTLVTNFKMCLIFADRFLHPALRQEQHQMTRNSSFSCHSNSTLKFKHKLKEDDTARSTKKQTNKQDYMLLGAARAAVQKRGKTEHKQPIIAWYFFKTEIQDGAEGWSWG